MSITFLKKCAATGLLLALTQGAAWAAPEEKVFAQPAQAVEALTKSLHDQDTAKLQELFGSDLEKLESVDPAVRQETREKLARLFDEGWSLSDTEEGDKILRLGYEGWAFPVPLVKDDSGWRFDTDAGVLELANRLVGRNELLAIETLRLVIEAQEAYRLMDYDGDGQKGYATAIVSGPGLKNGLYFPKDRDAVSPLEQLVKDPESFKAALAEAKDWFGYRLEMTSNGPDDYTLVAWPADYGKSGVMSFYQNSKGKLYEKDLGAGNRPKFDEKVGGSESGWHAVDAGF